MQTSHDKTCILHMRKTKAARILISAFIFSCRCPKCKPLANSCGGAGGIESNLIKKHEDMFSHGMAQCMLDVDVVEAWRSRPHL